MGWVEKLKAKITGKSDAKEEPKLITTVNTAYEINLVPEVKAQMIKTQKVRNIVLFACIVVSAISVGAVIILFGVKSGQDIAMSNQDKKLETMSAKLLGYDELDDLVAIQGQLAGLSDIANNKKILSRTFAALGVMMPEGEDSVQLSELRVNLDEDSLTLDGQADARVSPLIDYRVLESYKKGVALTKYDYGRYVDVDGTEIPTWCISETDEAGNAWKDGESYYAWWDLTKDGCAATLKGSSEKNETGLYYGKEAVTETAEREMTPAEMAAAADTGSKKDEKPTDGENVENNEAGEDAANSAAETGEVPKIMAVAKVKIWRTPQYNDWHRSGKMSLEGDISSVEHFESACTKYSGTTLGSGKEVKWTSSNDCMLAPDGLDVVSSTNARDESGNLVLKFTANLEIDPEFYYFKNKFMMAIGPMGQNVTDSYVQIQGMFTREATECAANDTDCLNNATNAGGR